VTERREALRADGALTVEADDGMCSGIREPQASIGSSPDAVGGTQPGVGDVMQ